MSNSDGDESELRKKLDRITDLFDLDVDSLSFENLPDEAFAMYFALDRIEDGDVAEYLDCSILDVTMRRHHLNVPLRYDLSPKAEQFMRTPDENEKLRQFLIELTSESIAKALTFYIFRDGPIEDIHAGEKGNVVEDHGFVTDHEMEMLNKFMYNRLYFLIDAIRNDRWIDVFAVVGPYLSNVGKGWDKPFNVSNDRNRNLSKVFDL